MAGDPGQRVVALACVIDDLREKLLTWSAAWLKQVSAQLQSVP